MIKIFKLSLAVGLAVMMFGCGGGGLPGEITKNTNINKIVSSVADTNATKEAYLQAINDARSENQDCGEKGSFASTTALKWNDNLYKAALEHGYDMAKSDTFDHTGSGTTTDLSSTVSGTGSTVTQRIKRNGYTGYTLAGENIEAGTTTDTAKKAVQEWLKSDHHCANMMNPDFTEVGMARYEDNSSKYTNYWTQDFGKR